MSRTMRVTSGKALLAWSRVNRRRALEGLAPDVENCGAAIGAAFLECAASLQTLLGAIMPSTEGLSNRAYRCAIGKTYAVPTVPPAPAESWAAQPSDHRQYVDGRA